MTVPTVCHLVISLDHGGLERLVVDWATARHRRHPGSTIIGCLDHPGDLAAQLGDVPVHRLEANRSRQPWDRAAVVRLKALLAGTEGTSADVVHSHNLAAQQYAVLARQGSSTGHVHTDHGSNPHVRGWLNRWRLRWLARRTDHVVTVSAHTATMMNLYWGLPEDKLSIIPNGVTPHRPTSSDDRNARRAALQLPPDAVVIGSVGRLAPIKGYDRLLTCMPELLIGIPTLICLLIGDGPARLELEQQARKLGVWDAVRFAGFQPDARCYYDLMNLFVLPSRSEGLPVSLLEAMAAGCPVAVTQTGEQPAVLNHGACGVLLPDDESQWPSVMLAILQEGPKRQTMVNAAMRRVAEQYTAEATLAAYETLYENSRASRC
ncbi:MAG: glycosyltransferase family 4 protein [Verrucomicrobia bacterium]|nr:glycosyltransferase family 4 protein [Verrucomicrobiota bacterium]